MGGVEFVFAFEEGDDEEFDDFFSDVPIVIVEVGEDDFDEGVLFD